MGSEQAQRGQVGRVSVTAANTTQHHPATARHGDGTVKYGVSTSSFAMDDAPGIQVTVSPSQSAYFAGEAFQVTITFTNTNEPLSSLAYDASPHQQQLDPSFTPAHRRAAHSVAYPSSVPSTPKTASYLVSAPPTRAREVPIPKRKGLIGKGKEREVSDDSAVDTIDGPLVDHRTPQPRRKHLPKALSVSGFSPTSPKVTGSPIRHHLPRLDIGEPPSPGSPFPNCESYIYMFVI